MLNAGGTTGNYDTNLCNNVQPKLWANKRDIEIHAVKSRSWLLDLPQGGRVLRVATIVIWDVDPTGFVTLGSQQHFQPRPTPLGSRTHPTGLHGCEATAGLGKEYNSESPQMLLSELP